MRLGLIVASSLAWIMFWAVMGFPGWTIMFAIIPTVMVLVFGFQPATRQPGAPQRPRMRTPSTAEPPVDWKSKFEEAYIAVARFSVPKEERQTLYEIAMNFPREAELLRCLQIMRESLDIALQSKKKDTAAYRAGLAEEQRQRCMAEFSDLLTDRAKAGIQAAFDESWCEFSTSRYLNVAKAHRVKSSDMKTAKARAKYLQLAREAIGEGLQDPAADKDRLNAFLATLPADP